MTALLIFVLVGWLLSIFFDAFIDTKRAIELLDYIEANRDKFFRYHNMLLWKIKSEKDVDIVFSYMLSVEKDSIFSVYGERNFWSSSLKSVVERANNILNSFEDVWSKN